MRWILIAAYLFATSTVADECPASFDSYISKFETNREFQQENTLFLLKYSFVDSTAQPEPATKKANLTKSEVVARQESIYPLLRKQKTIPLSRKVERLTQEKVSIRLYKPDTGYLLEYQFEKIGECWKLVKFDDFSL